MGTVRLENDCRGAFQSSLRMCKLANLTGETVEMEICNILVTAKPGDDPEAIYQKIYPPGAS
jgi:hypothetical protein